MEFHLFDAEYVRKLAVGDPSTESHFSAYFGKYILTKLRARRIPREMAEDIQQETLLRVLRAIRQGSGVTQPERFGAFVNAVSNNVLLEFQHKAKRHPQVDQDTPEAPDKTVMIDETLVTEETRRVVAEVLDELDPKDREILRLVFFEEEDRLAVAEAFGVVPNYLRVLLHRAKASFRAAYKRRERTVQRMVALFIICNAAVLKLTIE